MSLPTIHREVQPPKIIEQPGRMTAFAQQLRMCGYNVANCAQRLGVFPRLGVNFWPQMRSDWEPRKDDPIDNLISLFIDGTPLSTDHIAKHTSSWFVDTALTMGLVQESDGLLKSNLCLFPCYWAYLATDRPEKNTVINQVMWLWGESFILGGLVNRIKRNRAIDLGTGSGIHAILAANHCSKVIGADVNPRAIAFSRFNAALNGTANVEFVLSDLFNSIDGTCDLLTANPPYAPDSAAKPGDNFWSGGVNGTDLLRRIIAALPSRLEQDGTAHIVSLYPNPAGTKIRDHFDEWLGGALADWDVLDHTWPVPHYEDMLSEQPFRGDKSAWRFGVVSLRRSKNGNGWWKEVGGRGWFFGDDGRCKVVADFAV